MLRPIDLTAAQRANRIHPLLTSALLVFLATASLAGCKQDAGSAPAPQMPQVEVVTAATTTVPDEPEFIGQAEASRPVEIRSQVTGLIKAVLYQEGRDVKKGDRLYRSIPFRFKLRRPVPRQRSLRPKPKSSRPSRIWRASNRC